MHSEDEDAAPIKAESALVAPALCWTPRGPRRNRPLQVVAAPGTFSGWPCHVSILALGAETGSETGVLCANSSTCYGVYHGEEENEINRRDSR